jgi:hypothetical protein
MVQYKLIELFQEWALLFQSDSSLSYLFDTYCTLKATKRVIFPIPAKSLDQVDPLSIVSSIAPPDWSDSPNCQRCRDQFTMTNRKHHCRKCGGTFCQLCSSNEMVLFEMGINEPVRVCDSCYRQPTAVNTEKRQAKVFEKRPFEDAEDAELKKAIEISLKEQENKPQVDTERYEDEEALKKAIEASLKEAGPNHMTPPQHSVTNQQKCVKVVMFNQVELENISMFYQLIGRLVRTRPQLSQEDVHDLRKLAGEMKKLQKRPTEDFNVKNQLEESLKGYELLFGPETHSISVSSDSIAATTTVSRQQMQSPPRSLTEDLNTMKNEVFGDAANNVTRGPEISLVKTRLGSLSLENQIAEAQPQTQTQSLQPHQNSVKPAYHSNTSLNSQSVHQPTPLPAYHNKGIQNQIHPHNPYQSQLQDQVISPPVVQSSSRHSMPIMDHGTTTSIQHLHSYIQPRSRIMPIQSTPVQMCPDMTIHPHPIHPSFTHANPYAKPVEQQAEEISLKVKTEQKKAKKSKKKSVDKEEKKRRKKEKSKKKIEQKKMETAEGTSKKTKDSKSGEKRIKSIKTKMIDEEKPKKKRSKHKDEPKVKKEHSKSKEQNVNSKDKEVNLDLVTNAVDEGRRSPINLIDL